MEIEKVTKDTLILLDGDESFNLTKVYETNRGHIYCTDEGRLFKVDMNTLSASEIFDSGL